MNTSEPDLVHNKPHKEESVEQSDTEFLRQLAREFPPQESLKQVTPELPQISTAFNRKLSIHRTPSNRNSIIETDFPVMAPAMLTTGLESTFSGKRSSVSSSSHSSNSPHSTLTRDNQYTPFDKEKSPQMGGNGSISSAEDESGFSSMSSFQEIGLPISTIMENEKECSKDKLFWLNQDVGGKGKLMMGTAAHPIHRRWSSNPVEATKRDPLRVLWV